MRIARALAVVVALAACAWFVLGIRQAHDTDLATAIVNGRGAVTAHDAAHVNSLLNSAKTLNPDVQVVLLRSQLALRQRNYPRAIGLAKQATVKEPDNVSTWLALAVANFDSGKTDLAAVAKMGLLDPQLLHQRKR
jgi:Flp pilus assembly protein TadD